MVADLDVIVGRDPATLPFGILVGLDREPPQRRPLDGIEQLTPALAEGPHHLRVDRRYTLPDRRVQLVEREEPPLSQLRQYAARASGEAPRAPSASIILSLASDPPPLAGRSRINDSDAYRERGFTPSSDCPRSSERCPQCVGIAARDPSDYALTIAVDHK